MDRIRPTGIGEKCGRVADRSSKKNAIRTRFGLINLSRGHRFSASFLGSRTSPYLQDKLVLLGSHQVFSEVPDLVEQLLGITTNATNAFRCCRAVSDELDDSQLETPSAELAQQLCQSDAVIYGMVDGSMLPVGDGWQETKVGRVFNGVAYSDLKTKELGWILAPSEYVANRGHYREFTPAFEGLLSPASAAQKVFISDGVPWIRLWLAESYPGCVHILDIFHVLEKIASVAQDAPEPVAWFERQRTHLLASELGLVLEAIKTLPAGDRVAQQQVVNYLTEREGQMDYAHYRGQGWMIGSGPVESAHRVVLQTRMKRSGQHWSEMGCDKMLKLRVAYRSGKAHLIQHVFRRKPETTQD
jgi:hypothetical protein